MRYPPLSQPYSHHLNALNLEEKTKYNRFIELHHRAKLYWADYKNYFPHTGPLAGYQLSRSEFIYLSLHEQGIPARDLAKFCNVTVDTISAHLRKARGKWTAVHDAIGAGEIFDAFVITRKLKGIK